MEALAPHGIFVLLLTCVAIVLFTRSRIPLETSALGVLVVLLAVFELVPFRNEAGDLSPSIFFAGFGHEALVSICALMIMGKGLERTGALQPLAVRMARLWPRFPNLALLLTLVVGAALSAFVNNTPIVVLLLPMLVAVCLRNDVSTSGILLPMGLATIVGGMATTIGTSTNLLVVTLARDMGIHEFGMFDFALPVALSGAVGIIFLWAVAPRLLPSREPPLTNTSPRVFTGTITIDDESPVVGKTVADARALTSGRMRIEEIRRDDVRLMRLPTVVLASGDELIVSDTPESLKDFEQELGATLQPEDQPVGLTPGEKPEEDRRDEVPEDEQQRLAEIAVTTGSILDQRTLDGVNFESRFGLRSVALHQPGSTRTPRDFASERLSAGDVILVQGTQESVDSLKATGELLVLDGTVELPVRKHSGTALTIMALVIALAAFGVAPISVASTSGVLAMILTRCLKWSDVGGSLAIPVIMIIVASLALGSALIETGGASFLAASFLTAVSGLPLVGVLAAMMISLALATNIVSNNAAAIIGTPIAVDVASSLGAPVEPFLLAVIFGANMSFATPIGYKTNLLVMTAGGYQFSDFLRVGIPLTIVMTGLLTTSLWLLYDL